MGCQLLLDQIIRDIASTQRVSLSIESESIRLFICRRVVSNNAMHPLH
ncbi:Uncharacterised protein [Budvicia aquatica]|uniref:Uncharacterized protein n=1 Tax=Budvicia aquatica TaxID=82979 RepID=A0A484ZFS6_9GAMM|nr:Uncharacterised protein [Budvicia aquatica]